MKKCLDMFWHFSHKKSSTISLFPRAALTPTSYHLAGIDSPPKESISEPICFHCQMLSGPPHRKAPFPECGSGIKRHLPRTLSRRLAAFCLAPSCLVGVTGCPQDARAGLTVPSGNATVSSQEASDSEAKNASYAFTVLVERNLFYSVSPS